ncbi:MAG: DEAD/DEAH box helicase family protein, partial [Ruminococcus sp.]|nr:DEAD/DEAH box helicase family protein [Ruminococcus sp.]
FVGGVNRFTALHDEITRGTGFQGGKSRVQKFYEEKKPTNKEFADFLKHEYGIGGHSGSGEISLVDHDSNGMFFTLDSGEKFKFTWSEIAETTAELIDKGEYIIQPDTYQTMQNEKEAEITADISEKTDISEKIEPDKNSVVEKLERLKNNVTEEKPDTVEIGDKFRNKMTGEISEVVSLSGALPYITDDCTVKRESGGFAITGNISYETLLDENLYEYIGNSEIVAEKAEIPEKTDNKIIFEMVGGGTFVFKDNEMETLAEIDMSNGKITYFSDDLSEKDKEKIAEKSEQYKPKEQQSEKSENFTITDDALGNGGTKSKFRANVEAIKTLKTLEKEHRPATDSEKETLSKYVGWGGIPQAFDGENKAWSNEFSELKSLLTVKEYSSARASTLDAFFTSPTVIDGIYQALENFGFEGGNVLEPSCGVGNFFGKMPDEMRENSKLYGVEIDSISGRIAQKLYPDADIAIQGFEKNNFQNGGFDVAVGNVPFGELSFKDDIHGTTKLHDYFFAESLEKVKNGGILAFVTSAGTLDKRDESKRRMLSEKADFIGAVRLPGGKNGAFKDNAGTEVTTDIIFLQKNENKNSAEIPDWVHIGETSDGLPINQYFAENPDMVLGQVVEGNKLYGTGTMVIADENSDLSEQLKSAVSKLSATISDEKAKDVYAKSADGEQLKVPSKLRNYSFFEQDNKIYFKTTNQVCHCRFDTKNSQFQRAKAFINLRDLTRELIEAQELDKPDAVIKDLQSKLTSAYDSFYKKYGLIHSKSNKRYFSDDVSYNLVAGLEKKYEKNKLIEKSDIFTKRTIQPPKAIEHVETAMEALTLSVAEKAGIDFEYMSSLTGMTEDELKHDLQGKIFKVPHSENTYQTASEYLSGDIRKKLDIAEEIAEYDADFAVNVNALKAAMPEPLKAGDIDIKIGATWLDPKYYEQFMYELLQTPRENRADVNHYSWQRSKPIAVEYSEHSGTWHIDNKKADESVISSQQFGTKKMNAYEIIEHLLNLKEPKVYKTIEVPDGMGDVKEKRVVDIDVTKVVQRKADKIREAFKKWIFKDPARREEIVGKYNELFNSVKPREYDGSALTFPMMNTEIKLHEHQKNAIAHALFGGNTLFAHSVGAGKTFEMIATAMESKRLGLCTKSLFAVPNHLTEQIGDDFQKLYPGANILVATKKDFQKENRQQLFAKIATGNFDAIIIGHSQLGMIPISKERQEAEIKAQIDDIVCGIAELKASEGSKFQVKAMERTKKSLEKQLAKLEKNHDDTITFEQLGVDKLFVDEAHEFKNCAKRCA